MAEMTREEVDVYLDSHGGYAVLSTIGKDGYPHAVPLGFFRSGDEVVLPVRGQRKVNIGRNPKVAVTVESGRTMKELKGVVIRGDATLVEDPAAVLELVREGARRRGTPEDQLPTTTRTGMAYVRVRPRKIASWDNTKA
ncbi:MAG: hypothetical protein EPO16_00970 [Dehalococcoidia bacterium]|nr:MAG: hypothetical protein EPO16_00970 [Dehalococcoidia bacterium]